MQPMSDGPASTSAAGRRMPHRTVVAVVVACLGFGVLMVAASSGPVQMWHEPPPSKSSPRQAEPEPPREPVEVPTSVPPEPMDVADNDIVAIVTAIILGIVALSVVYALIVTLAGRLRRRRRDAASPLPGESMVLPDDDEPVVSLDVDAQLAALAQGTPRNAIVACWLRLEDDVADAGLPRRPSETSAEFTARVLASYSLDPTPVVQLAALYREARFSRHAMDQADREQALVALRQVHAALVQPELADTPSGPVT
jgi:hypothetical protein